MPQMWDNMALTKKVKDLETPDQKVRASLEEAKKRNARRHMLKQSTSAHNATPFSFTVKYRAANS